jgi:hypothetical protein
MQTPRVAHAALARSAETRRDGSVAPNLGIRPPLALPSRPRRGARAIEERAAPIRREWRSGRQALAAARAAGVQNFTTADRFHARAKPMSAFANEFARLIGPLHGSNSKSSGNETSAVSRNKPTRTSHRRHFEPRSDPGKIQGDGKSRGRVIGGLASPSQISIAIALRAALAGCVKYSPPLPRFPPTDRSASCDATRLRFLAHKLARQSRLGYLVFRGA